MCQYYPTGMVVPPAAVVSILSLSVVGEKYPQVGRPLTGTSDTPDDITRTP
jgi:hypothetical protein